MEKGYNEEMLHASIEKARAIPRDRALKKAKPKNKAHCTVFAVPFDPRLPAISSTMAWHWRSMTSHDSYLQQVFKEPPLIAFKRQNNIRNFLVRAKVPNKTSSYPKRFLKGMKRCRTSCTACPYIKKGKIVKINNKNWNINRKLNCESYNVVYAIICNLVYIWETKRMLKYRLAEHRGYVTNGVTSQATGEHFNMPGHSLADLSVTIIEQTFRKNSEYRKEQESYFIRRFDTFYNGINKQKWIWVGCGFSVMIHFCTAYFNNNIYNLTW